MAQWKFQITSNRPDFIAKGRLMDSVCDGVAGEVNDALRYPFKFHKVNKIVVRLGEGPVQEPDYVEQLGVGLKQWRDFDLDSYQKLDAPAKIAAIRNVVLRTFEWLEQTFDDAQFVAIGRMNLAWAQVPPNKSLEQTREG
jgi:hypothetical protein